MCAVVNLFFNCFCILFFYIHITTSFQYNKAPIVRHFNHGCFSFFVTSRSESSVSKMSFEKSCKIKSKTIVQKDNGYPLLPNK